jgi:demethylmenaquinone methyltransferase/2-methoxy-6-polyprenyl-1,4-benzoquinol methylase
MFRVLKAGGRLVSLDFSRPESRIIRAVYLTYLTVVGSTVGWLLHGDPDTYRYIPESIRGYVGPKGIARTMREVGFRDVNVEPVLGGLLAIHIASK